MKCHYQPKVELLHQSSSSPVFGSISGVVKDVYLSVTPLVSGYVMADNCWRMEQEVTEWAKPVDCPGEEGWPQRRGAVQGVRNMPESAPVTNGIRAVPALFHSVLHSHGGRHPVPRAHREASGRESGNSGEGRVRGLQFDVTKVLLKEADVSHSKSLIIGNQFSILNVRKLAMIEPRISSRDQDSKSKDNLGIKEEGGLEGFFQERVVQTKPDLTPILEEDEEVSQVESNHSNWLC
ncbi:hypothetical protein HAX54_040200 [Datura stramonium]|uniref:Uncharacterized protein n=1 Tax=Datura stramonium TaxID=4076 RepID=A0ABS8VMD2_DATST|nr:hypothetical protein [Datura stramonium]